MSGFGTINSIKKKKDGEGDDNDETNTYYTGGANGRGGGRYVLPCTPPSPFILFHFQTFFQLPKFI